MKITLDTKELNQAVFDYLSSQGLSIDTDVASVEITPDGVKIDTNPVVETKETKDTKDAAKETKTEKKDKPKQTATPTQADNTAMPFDDNTHQIPETKDEVDKSDKDKAKDNDDYAAFGFKQSTTSEVRKLFA